MVFPLGRIVVTPGAATALEPDEVLRLVERHVAGDWGDLDEHDRQVNRDEIRRGGRVLSQYTSASGQRIWIITELWRLLYPAHGENLTTILLPDEY